MAATRKQEREELNQRLEYFHELVEQVEAHIRSQGFLEQGHRMDSKGKSFDNLQLQVEGCIGQLATVTSTTDYVASKFKTL